MSSKYQQNPKQSRKWFAPFGLGIIVGIVLTLVVGQFRSEMEEEATVANAALEGARPAERESPELAAAPEREPEAVPPPSAAAPAAAAPAAPAAPAAQDAQDDHDDQAAAPAAAPAEPAVERSTGSAPNAPLAAPAPAQPTAAPARPAAPAAAAAKAAAPPVYAAAEKREPSPAQPATPVAPATARPQQPAASSIVHAPPPTAAAQPAAAAQSKPAAAPAAPVDPNSEDAKLAAAAQVRVKGDTPIDSMLDQALTGEKKAAAPAPAAPPTLAQTPSREDVVNTMSVLVPAIRGCAQGQSGLAPMSIVVLSDGRVESAALSSGPFQGTASGRCMEGVVRRARFPHFKQANFRVQFPFAVQ